MLNIVRRNFKSQFSYLQRFIASPRTVGSLVPSSPWLCQAMLNQIDWTQNLNIAELGAADGVLTKRILSHMSANSSLQAYEIQPHFVHALHQLKDSRLQIADRSAEQLDQEYDVVFCLFTFAVYPNQDQYQNITANSATPTCTQWSLSAVSIQPSIRVIVISLF